MDDSIYIIDFGDYISLGFATVPESEFRRYLAAAAAVIKRYTFGRVKRANISEASKYGVCEIIDIFYGDDSITGFSNDGYSESYVKKDAAARVEDVINMYFGRDMLCRASKADGGNTDV